MAIRLEKAGWSDAETWLRMQLQRDLWEARQCAGNIHVTPFAAIAPLDHEPPSELAG
jgi:plasmid maintenance system antidote protein VapI